MRNRQLLAAVAHANDTEQLRIQEVHGKRPRRRHALRNPHTLLTCHFLLLLMMVLMAMRPSAGWTVPRRAVARPWATSSTTRLLGVLQDDEDEEEEFVAARLPDESDDPESWPWETVAAMTVQQLKQQLRLRGLKVSGRKEELRNRLWRASIPDAEIEETSTSKKFNATEAQAFAAKQGKELIDVTAYLDEDDIGKDVKSSTEDADKEIEKEKQENAPSKDPEVWGRQARIVEDYEGRRPIVDGLSRTVMEYTGSNQTTVQAFVVASHAALKPFLAGNLSAASPEQQLREIQQRREEASRRPVRWDDEAGLEEGDEYGIYTDVAVDRDWSDWGKYTPTGAQLSASQVSGVLLLTDVYGAFEEDIQALAETIAFECQPVIVMVPDLFGGNPWVGPTDGRNPAGQDYETWRSQMSDDVVNINIRAAAACLRERYRVSTVSVWGTCYGGGRALEVAAGHGPIHDVDGSVGPPPVQPSAVVAWYPTRYKVDALFGPARKVAAMKDQKPMAVMGVFADQDSIPGATAQDAAALKELLAQDERVKDSLVKVFLNQGHGFAHSGWASRLAMEQEDEDARFLQGEFGGGPMVRTGGGDAEVAFLLSTAFFETYSRAFLPTVGPPISLDEKEAALWSEPLEMLSRTEPRDVRQELEHAVESFVEEPLGGHRIDPTDDSQEEELTRLLRSMQDPEGDYGGNKIEEDDDLTTIYAKLTASDENFQIF